MGIQCAYDMSVSQSEMWAKRSNWCRSMKKVDGVAVKIGVARVRHGAWRGFSVDSININEKGCS